MNDESKRPGDAEIAQQIELSVCQLDWLSPLPCISAKFLSQLNQLQITPSSLTELIESDPVLAVRIFSLLRQQDLTLPAEDFSIRRAIEELSLRQIRDALLSAEPYPASAGDNRAEFRKQLTLHCIAVACCARDIAPIISPGINPDSAYLAGLLHDIAKFALDEAMPKSFARIVEDANSQNCSICKIERRHLGTDHALLGKRLAKKWRLTSEIAISTWLHHSDAARICKAIPEAKIARIVQLADSIARHCKIGQSGSYDSPDLSSAVEIAPDQLRQICQNLPAKVAQKSKILGLDSPTPHDDYYKAIHATAVQLAGDNTKLSSQNTELQTASIHFDFITEFLSSINSTTAPIELAEDLAVRWQKFYQTGPVCLYFAPAPDSQTIEAVIVQDHSNTKTLYPKTSASTLPIPNNFAVFNAADYTDWLFKQSDVEFDSAKTILVPLLSAGRAIAAVVFELRHPAKADKLAEKFRTPASVAAIVIDMALTWHTQQRFAECFAQLLGQPQQPQSQSGANDILTAVTEMAAGAAHELNNPLSVISGRAQLLAEAETDPEKKQTLELIRRNAAELSGIIDCLMNFAKPAPPRPTLTPVKQIIDDAVRIASGKTNTEQLDIQFDVSDDINNVLVDSAQIVSAIAGILSNSLESYPDGVGPIKVTANQDAASGFVKLKIIDLGCGMDADTLQKASQPFFSAKPAGRKRGMGLATAHRLIQLNNGSVNIQSQPDTGTTVTVLLPHK